MTPTGALPPGGSPAHRVTRYAWLSIATALTTMALKAAAAATGSVSLLSDALESLVNLAGAAFTLWMLRLGAEPPDERHAHGHEKAEYFASGFEGLLILIAGIATAVAAVDRLLNPAELGGLSFGVAISTVATLLNLAVARVLLDAGRRHGSVALSADGAHLMTDVWTTFGVLAGLGLVSATGADWLDPALALVVAAHILLTAWRLLSGAADGLMDAALPTQTLADLERLLDQLTQPRGAQWHALRTRVAATRAFVSVHLLVPGDWSVHDGHELCEEIEAAIRGALNAPGTRATVLTHLEPLEDPRAYADQHLDPGH